MNEHSKQIEVAERRLQEARVEIVAADEALAAATRAVGEAIATGKSPDKARVAMRDARDRTEGQAAALPFLEAAVEAARTTKRNADEATHRATLRNLATEQLALAEQLELAMEEVIALVRRSVEVQEASVPSARALGFDPFHRGDQVQLLGRWAATRIAHVTPGAAPSDHTMSATTLPRVTRVRLERDKLV